MFESGLDFTGWHLEEWLIVGGGLLLILLLIIFMVMQSGKKSNKQVPTKSDESKMTLKVEPKDQQQEPTKAEKAAPVEEAKETTQITDEPKVAEEEKTEPVKKSAKYHISQNKDTDAEHASEWRVRKEGSSKTIKYFRTQKEAIAYAEKLAENQDSSIVIHKKDGTIRKQDYSKK